MSDRLRLPAALLAAVLVIAVAQLVWAYSRLPEIVASHFDGAGRANGWMSRDAFVLSQLGLLGLIVVCFVGFPQALGRIPVRLISLPNRDYWFAPERRADTLDFMRRQLWWMACATILFLAAIAELVIGVNLGVYTTLPTATMLVLLGAFLLYTLIWSLRFVRHFFRATCAT